jgi:hypothetical protein
MLEMISSLRKDNSCLSAAEESEMKIVELLKEISLVLLAMVSPTISFQLFFTVN